VQVSGLKKSSILYYYAGYAKLGSDKSDPYIKRNTLYEKVLSFELWFFVFSFKFLI